MHSRRRYLSTLGVALAAVAGCLDGDDGDVGGEDTPGTSDGTPSGTSTTTVNRTTSEPLEDLSVTDLAVKEAVTFYAWPASTTVLAPEDRQFVLATVDAPEDATTPSFTFEAGGETWTPGHPNRSASGRSVVDGRERGLVAGTNGASGYLAFTVPSPLEASNPRIRLPDRDAEWHLPRSAVERLAKPSPTFSLDELSVPDAVTRPEPLDVSTTVTNTSDVDGEFLAAVHLPTHVIADDDESSVVSGPVGAGETREFSLRLGTDYTVGETDTVSLSVGGYVDARREVEVRVEDS